MSRFTLNIVAGSHGPLGVSGNLCSRRGKKATADVTMVGQNGDRIVRHQRLQHQRLRQALAEKTG